MLKLALVLSMKAQLVCVYFFFYTNHNGKMAKKRNLKCREAMSRSVELHRYKARIIFNYMQFT